VRTPDLYDTQYSYDARGRTTLVSSETRQAVFAYYAHGNLLALTDPLGRQTKYRGQGQGTGIDILIAGRVAALSNI
jgi:YD repeat-containing protein